MGTGKAFRAQVVGTELEFERLELHLTELETLDPKLYQRFKSVVDEGLADCRADLDRLLEIKAEPPEDGWATLAETKAKCDELVNESVSFIHGALVRNACFDDGICAIADRLLDGLSSRSTVKWNRLSVPADSEFVTDLAQIVRLRAGDVSVWNLPVAVHEFGHFFGPRVCADRRHPFEDLLAKHAKGSVAWSHLHEYFADLFASYAVGPAFLCVCIMSRFDPSDAVVPSATHPSHQDRVFLMLEVLRALDANSTPVYGALLPALEEHWAETLRAAGRRSELSSYDVDRLKRVFASLYPIIANNAPLLRYDGMERAHDIKRAILQDKQHLPATACIADVLNGAWLSRIDQPADDALALRLRGQTALRFARHAMST